MALRNLLTNSRSNTFDTPDVCYVIFGCCYEEVTFGVFLPLWQGSSLDSTLFLTDASQHRLDLFVGTARISIVLSVRAFNLVKHFWF